MITSHLQKREHAKAGIAALLMTVVAAVTFAQDATQPGQPAAFAGSGTRFADDPKLLAPLPPPPPGSEPPSPDPRNFEGTWAAQRMLDPPPGAGPMPPFTPSAAKEYQHHLEMMAKGMPIGNTAARCRPMQAIAVGADLFPAEIVQTPGQIVILNEEGRTRWQIQMNQQHPKNLQPSFWGHSVGRWEGDTLVVDTVGFNGQFDFLSPRARIISRIRKIDGGGRLEIKTITEDPVNYAKPFERSGVSAWHPELTLLEFQCEENLEGAKEGLIIK